MNFTTAAWIVDPNNHNPAETVCLDELYADLIFSRDCPADCPGLDLDPEEGDRCILQPEGAFSFFPVKHCPRGVL